MRRHGRVTPELAAAVTSIIYQIRTPDRALDGRARQEGHPDGHPYPSRYTLKAFDFLGYKQGQFPHSEKIATETMSIPMFRNSPRSNEESSAVAALAKQCNRRDALTTRPARRRACYRRGT
jgi:hypothetical protein